MGVDGTYHVHRTVVGSRINFCLLEFFHLPRHTKMFSYKKNFYNKPRD
jgi:hypothetical protein